MTHRIFRLLPGSFAVFLGFIASGVLNTTSSFAQGSRVGRGGDGIVIEFEVSAQRMVRLLRYYPGFVAADKYVDALANTLVVAKDHTFLNGVEKDAVNYSNPNEIDLNASRWDERYSAYSGAEASIQMRRRLVLSFHEYSLIAGYDDSDGNYSLEFTELLERDAAGANIQNKLFCDFDSNDTPSPYLRNSFCF